MLKAACIPLVLVVFIIDKEQAHIQASTMNHRYKVCAKPATIIIFSPETDKLDFGKAIFTKWLLHWKLFDQPLVHHDSHRGWIKLWHMRNVQRYHEQISDICQILKTLPQPHAISSDPIKILLKLRDNTFPWEIYFPISLILLFDIARVLAILKFFSFIWNRFSWNQ